MSEYRQFSVISGANTSLVANGDGAVALKPQHDLLTINANVTAANAGPVQCFVGHGWLIGPGFQMALNILASGWLRSGNVANDDGLYWTGRESMTPGTVNYIFCLVRNDTVSTQVVSMNWSVGE